MTLRPDGGDLAIPVDTAIAPLQPAELGELSGQDVWIGRTRRLDAGAQIQEDRSRTECRRGWVRRKPVFRTVWPEEPNLAGVVGIPLGGHQGDRGPGGQVEAQIAGGAVLFRRRECGFRQQSLQPVVDAVDIPPHPAGAVRSGGTVAMVADDLIWSSRLAEATHHCRV